MPSVDITQQAIVVEAPVDVSVVEFTSTGVTVEVPSTTLVLEFGTAGVLVPGSGLTGGGTLTGNVPIGLSPATVASLLKADTAVQPGANLSAFVDDVGYATDAEVFALLGDLGGAYQPLNEQLTSISGLATTVFGRSFLTLANEAAARTLIGVYSSSEVLSLLATKANVSHTHTTADITGGISWSNLTGIPLTFPPGAHTHVKADVTDFAHTHLLADVTDYVAPVLAHSGLTGLAADDHTQYHTDARGDARYYTQSTIDSMLSGLAVSGHTHDYLPLAGGTLTNNLLVTHGGASYTDPSSGLSGIGIANTGTSANYNAFGIVTGVGAVFQVRNNGDVWALRRLAAAYFGGSTPADLNVLSTVQNTAELFCTSFGPTNGPGGANYYSGLYFRHNISSDYGTALVTGANSGEPVLHLRQKVNGTWGSYRKVYHEGNFDPATYLPLTGGTLTGNLAITSGGTLMGPSSKVAITMDDNWLRLNQSSHFTSGVYTPGLLRADGGLNAGFDGTRHQLYNDGSSIQRSYDDVTLTALHEWYIDQGTASRPIYLRFHQGSRWYYRIKANANGFAVVGGADETYTNMYAGTFFEDNVMLSSKYAPLSHSHDYAATAHTHLGDAVVRRSIVRDHRSETYLYPTPNQLTGYSVEWYFNDSWGGSSWRSGFSVAGWDTGSYGVWQMSGSSTNTLQEDWYLRAGVGGTWGAWRTIMHSGNPIVAADLYWNNAGGTHGDVADFNNVTHFGPKFLQAATNGPGITSATQYYSWSMGLGSNYLYSAYVCQFAIPRTPVGGNPVLSVRYRENGTWGSWAGIGAGFLQNSTYRIQPENGSQWRVTTPHAWLDIGPANSGYAHFSTNATYGHYFTQDVTFGAVPRKYQLGALLWHASANEGSGVITHGTGTPSGGANGDVHFQYT